MVAFAPGLPHGVRQGDTRDLASPVLPGGQSEWHNINHFKSLNFVFFGTGCPARASSVFGLPLSALSLPFRV